jgi:phage anti-repressor protein
MEKLMVTHVGTAEPEEEIVQDPFTLDMDIVSAIRLIQKNERGRQGRYRIMLILKQFKQKKIEAEMKRKIREGLIKE